MVTSATLRRATPADVAGIWRVRFAVRENRLSNPDSISDADVVEAIEVTGRGWVVEVAGETGAEIVAFAVGNARTGNIWALFVDPGHEGRGHGRRLHDTMIAWLWSQGLAQLNLSTTPGTRAEAFYRRAGWRDAGPAPHGEIRLELDRPAGG
jgi:GNAT superfamily N-acetyltransferase